MPLTSAKRSTQSFLTLFSSRLPISSGLYPAATTAQTLGRGSEMQHTQPSCVLRTLGAPFAKQLTRTSDTKWIN
ncbi:hypothetical protein FOPG_19179 [Fusarium oxysporum f. sp. conglutinans race 2 54008]|uniref:Uncharacterized protein n=1 Tax=Fusarium oxysporum f. sp. conglutinans race 2 54008 TaxID=1089457 RepID=X0GXC9_FUSOX|nr:hypothetical protein FOPG_19179 [Fusarium oxysporum f. sp. conglutinans race 2 54008]